MNLTDLDIQRAARATDTNSELAAAAAPALRRIVAILDRMGDPHQRAAMLYALAQAVRQQEREAERERQREAAMAKMDPPGLGYR